MNNVSLSQPNNTYFFRHITPEDGLLHNNVYDIVQDKRGFIWIATANGLQRYDGNRFLNFHDMLNDPLQASSGTPSLYTDNTNNMLWIQKSVNVEKLDLTTKRITFYKPEDLFRLISPRFEKYKDKNNFHCFISAKAIFTYDSLTKKYKLDALNSKPFTKGASSDFVTNAATGETWMGSNTNGLTLFDAKTKGIYTAAYNPIHNVVLQAFEQRLGKHDVAVRRVMLDSHQNLWVATWGKWFYQYHTATGKVLSYSLSSLIQKEAGGEDNNTFAAVSCFYEDDHHTVWISTDNAGLLKYNEAVNQFEPVVMNNRDKTSDPYNYSIFCIFQDREENIWLGTDKGITIFNPYRTYFQSVHHEENNEASLPNNEIECYIQTRSGDILAGTWGGGITVYDSAWNFRKNIRFSELPDYNLVWNFVQNNDGTIWAGCQHGYIHIYNPVDKSIHTIHPPELHNYTVRCMVKDGEGNIWFGLHDGKVAEWNKQQNKFYSCNDSTTGIAQSYTSVLNIFFDKQQRCWVSTERGLKQFDTKKRMYSAIYLPDKNNPYAISANTVEGIEQYNDSTLIIGTLFGGFNLFNTNTKTFSKLTFSDSLFYNTIYAIKKDTARYFWFTTDYGLFKFTPADKKIIRYHMEAGIINSAFKSLRFYALKNGQWVTSTSTEIICFHPTNTKGENGNKTKIEVTGLRVFNKAVSIDSLLENNQPVQLSYQQNFITIEWAKPSFSTLHQSSYYYRLEGINNGWVNAGQQAFATYTNLDPGEYIFDVKAGDGMDVTSTTSFKIIISPPFWKRGWFILLIALCVISFLYLLIQWRIKNLRAVEREKLTAQEAKIEMLSMSEKLSIAKLEALRSQMNPHFIFNCLTSIDNLIQTGEKEKATTYLARFAKLIRSILETSKSNTVPCWKDMETLKIYLEMEELRCDKKFRYHINMADDIVNGDYKVPPLVIQPFVENAIHHGLLNKREKNKELWITVWASHQHIHYLIRDNGVGRAKAAEYNQLNKPAHQSMGMQITIDRIHLFNQNRNGAVTITDLYDEQQQPAGTKVEVSLINQP